MTRTTFAVLALASLGCSQGGLGNELAAFKAAGHAPAGFADREPGPLQARACQSGLLAGIHALLCQYRSSEAVALGQEGAEAWIGQAPSGVVLRRDLFLLALADRDRIDPNGKTLAAIARTFRRQ